ncbi:MAG: InlB B-repeat-containing protein [Clostridiales Family XIII bacterium]|nr:InlB B-repeat-containing protein [Clostridiales Family XIII bacterium]
MAHFQAEHPGYTFNGWYTSTAGGMKISASTTVTNNVMYYAQWKNK